MQGAFNSWEKFASDQTRADAVETVGRFDIALAHALNAKTTFTEHEAWANRRTHNI